MPSVEEVQAVGAGSDSAAPHEGLVVEWQPGEGMRHGGRTRRFTAPLAVLAVVLIVPAADAVSMARQCRQACGDEIAACVAAGGRRQACKRETLRRYTQDGGFRGLLGCGRRRAARW